MKECIKVGLLGAGTVGSGVLTVLEENTAEIEKKVGVPIHVSKILVRDMKKAKELSEKYQLTDKIEDIVEDPEIDIVVELIGREHPAKEYIAAALEHKKNVVTANKDVLAKYGKELFPLAEENKVDFMFEASVGGGIPIIRPMSQCLVANNVDEIAGILNGTTNFILTKMIEDGMQFDDALKLAQELGFAERNPAADIEGHDACRKICILASLAYGKHVYPDSVHTEGITKITLEDVRYAEAFHCVIKLIGSVKRLADGKIDIIVAPMLVPNKSQLANIDYEFNGIMVRGDCTGDVVFYGKGAGKLPTASAVVADVIDCCKHLKTRKFLYWADGNGKNILPWEESSRAMYVRANGSNVAEKAEKLFGEVTVINKADAPADEKAFVVKAMPYNEFAEKIAQLEADGVSVLSSIRVADL